MGDRVETHYREKNLLETPRPMKRQHSGNSRTPWIGTDAIALLGDVRRRRIFRNEYEDADSDDDDDYGLKLFALFHFLWLSKVNSLYFHHQLLFRQVLNYLFSISWISFSLLWERLLTLFLFFLFCMSDNFFWFSFHFYQMAYFC